MQIVKESSFDKRHKLRTYCSCSVIAAVTQQISQVHAKGQAPMQIWARVMGSLGSFASSSRAPIFADLCLSQDTGKSVFVTIPSKVTLYTINEAHKQYGLLDTLFEYICYLEPPGKHLSKNLVKPTRCQQASLADS